METAKVTIIAKSHNGKIMVNTAIDVPFGDDDYHVTLHIRPKKLASLTTIDQLYGILADDHMPEIVDDLPFEQRDTFAA